MAEIEIITGLELGGLPQCLTPQQTAIALRCDPTKKGEKNGPPCHANDVEHVLPPSG